MKAEEIERAYDEWGPVWKAETHGTIAAAYARTGNVQKAIGHARQAASWVRRLRTVQAKRRGKR